VRMLVSLGLAGLLAISTSSVAVAQPSPSAKSAPKQATRSISGTVRSATPDVVVVGGREKGKDSEWTFAVDTTTNIRKGTKAIVPADLRAGDAVQVRFRERDGKAVAHSIVVKTARKDAPRKDAKKTAAK
jgi:hypothetical protein